MHVRSHYASPQKISEVTIQSHVIFIGIISSGGVAFSQTPVRSEQIAFQTVTYASQRSPTSGLAGAPDKFKEGLRGSVLVCTDWYHAAITNFPTPLFSIKRIPFPKLHLIENP